MENEKLSPELQRLLAEDPVAFFEGLVELRRQGQDPIDLGLIPGNPVTKKVKAAATQADQLIRHAGAAGDDWLAGVKTPSRDPIEAAIAAEGKYEDRLKQAIADKKWSKGLKKSSFAEIVEVATKVGPGAYTTGVAARETKIKRVFTELQPLQQSVSDAIQNMSDKTDADREKRLLTARKLMIEVGKKRRA